MSRIHRAMLSSGVFALAAPALIHNSAYANNLTGLIPDLYAALDVVSRELVGFLPSVSRAPGAERAAVGENVRYTVAPAMVAYDIIPAMNVPEPPDVTIGTGQMAITKSRGVPFGVTGEEQRGLNNGPGWRQIQIGLMAQGIRTLTNEMESDIAIEAALNASRAYGTPGTTPFASGVGDSAQTRKILDDNGAPLSGRTLVVGTAEGANLRTNNNLNRANEAGSTMTLRDGVLLDLHGFGVKESAARPNFIKGTGAGATTNGAAYPIGATQITLAAAGTGTIKTGDTVQFAGDTNKYQVAAGDADVSNGGVITIAAPGLRVAIPAAATAITVGNSAAYNVAFSADAIHFVTRAPALPAEGDSAIDRTTITDPRSGMVFEVSVYAVYRKVRYEIAAAWGQKAVKREHIALLLG